MMIKCPNCGKKTYDEYKCIYCNYTLNQKTNKFDPNIYGYLYDDYVKSNNKAITIRNGVAKFCKPMSEIKEIVDFIADEIYEKNDYRKKEEVEVGSIRYNTYHFSFIQYLIHNVIYKLIFVMVLLYVPELFKEIDFIKKNPIVLVIWYILIAGAVLYFVYAWLKISTSFIDMDFHEIRYGYQTINQSATHYDENRDELAWESHIKYQITKVIKIQERRNSFIIYGNIVRIHTSKKLGGEIIQHKTKRLTQIKISKCFKDNSKLINELKSKIKM